MSDADSLVHDFLTRFSAASDTGDADALGGCFADVFLAGDAHGARPVSRDAFLAALPRRREMFANAGLGAATLMSHSVQELDAHYLLVRTEWAAPLVDGSGTRPLSSSFLLHRAGDVMTVVAYLNHRGL